MSFNSQLSRVTCHVSHLDECEQEADDDAGGGAGAGGLRGGREDAGHAVGLGDHGGVAERVAEPDEEPHHAAREVRGLGHDDEGGGEGEEGADNQDAAQLAAARPHHRRVPVLPQHA